MQLTPTQKKARIALGVKLAGLGVIGLLVAPFIMKAIGGIIGLGVALVLGFVLLKFTPVIAMVIANWAVKAIVSEATKNPIPTLINQYQDKVGKLNEAKEKMTQFFASIESLRSSISEYDRKYPGRKGTDQDRLTNQRVLLTRLEQLKVIRTKKYQAAKDSVEQFRLTIEEAELVWKTSLSALAAKEAAGEEFDPMEELKTRTALGSVVDTMNLALTELDTAMMEEDTVPKITHQPSRIIDGEVLDYKTTVEVPRK